MSALGYVGDTGPAEQDVMPWARRSGDDVGTLAARLVVLAAPRPVNVVRVVAPVPPDWLGPTIARLNELLRLPPDWDGYGAEPIDDTTAIRALEFLSEHARTTTPPPSVVPLSDGGIQLEWSRESIDIEIEFHPDGSASLYVEDSESGEAWEGAPDGEGDERLGLALGRLSPAGV